MEFAEAFRLLTQSYPDSIRIVPLIILGILAVVAMVDAVTGRVPDWPVAIGALGGICSLAWYADWLVAGQRFLFALAAVFGLKIINNLFFKATGRDAFGFGDAKWTGLAVIGFGLKPVVGAWLIGAWLGLIWMALRWLAKVIFRLHGGENYVHFSPFLLMGLLAFVFKDWLIGVLKLQAWFA